MSKKKPTRPQPPRFFPTAQHFRNWLERNADAADALTVGFFKVGTGKRSITWPESVDEALCFGWIDGVRKRIDEHSYQIRFARRKAGSSWSTINIRRAAALIAANRMNAAGLAAFSRRIERKSGVYSYEQRAEPELTAADIASFKRNKAAWRFFEAVAPGYRRTTIFWVTSAKKPETRARRLTRLIEACAVGMRLLP